MYTVQCRFYLKYGILAPSAFGSKYRARACIVYGLLMERWSSEVFWTCACGIKVRAVLDMSKARETVQCPSPPCKVTRTLPGQIEQLSLWTEQGVWTAVDLSGLIRPANQS
jgi:hypothetical protein